MNPDTLIIINPKSGTRSRAGLPEAIDAVFGDTARVVYTERPGHATLLARQAVTDGYAKVVAVGGDGTINETANGLLGSPVPLAIVPFGSGNGLARDLHIPMRRDDALQVARYGHTLSIDCGSVADRNFFCTMGVGFDAKVSHEFANAHRRGLLTYSRIAVTNFLHYLPQTYTVRVDGETHTFKALIIAVCNAAQYGNNAYIAPRASMADGLLDVTVVERGNLGRLASAGFRLFNHTLDHSHIVHCLRGRHIVIERDEAGPAHIDGEALILPASLDIRCRPAALSVTIPAP